ncbi:UNVERIFIED_ORG: hypothetical protein ABIB63_001092 [Xanthomonas axonopodis]
MQLQHQRIHELCGQLKLEAMATHYPELASKAVSNRRPPALSSGQV